MDVWSSSISTPDYGEKFAKVVRRYAELLQDAISDIESAGKIRKIELNPYSVPEHLGGFPDVIKLAERGTVLYVSKEVPYELLEASKFADIAVSLHFSLLEVVSGLNRKGKKPGALDNLLSALELLGQSVARDALPAGS